MGVRCAAGVTLLAVALAGSGAHAAPATPERSGAEAGLVGIECGPERGLGSHRFRGVVIDTAGAELRRDVILTTAHGFPADTDRITEACWVEGPAQRQYAIDWFWRPVARGRGSLDDWAVLVTERRLRGELARQPVAAWPPGGRRAARAETPVRLPLRFFAAERACTLTPSGSAQEPLSAGFFSHTCRSWPGHSGSPILTADGGGVSVVGIHVGSRWIFERQASLKIGRFVDAEMLGAIRTATARAGTDRRRRR